MLNKRGRYDKVRWTLWTKAGNVPCVATSNWEYVGSIQSQRMLNQLTVDC